MEIFAAYDWKPFQSCSRYIQGNFDQTIKNLDSVLVAYYSPKCRSCSMMEPELAKVAQVLNTKQLDIYVAKIDISKNREIMGKHQVTKLPTLIFYVAGGIAKYKGKQKRARNS
jgi:thioredoxin-like negative regulator of GroEL